jgi:uncharacterized protein (DUF433 family)
MHIADLYPGIVSDSSVLAGKPTIKGTRVPVDLVLGQLASGMALDEVGYEYGLSPEDIRAALGYAAQRIAEELVYTTR